MERIVILWSLLETGLGKLLWTGYLQRCFWDVANVYVIETLFNLLRLKLSSPFKSISSLPYTKLA
jgi:hypothetical protein